MKTNDAIEQLAALAQENRLALFKELVKHHHPEPAQAGIAAGELARTLDIPAPTLSFHLKELSRAGLIQSDKQGRHVIYRADLTAMSSLIAFLLEDCCGGACNMIQKEAS